MSDKIFRGMNKELTAEDILMLAPLQLAYIGDAVYELMVRTKILSRGRSVNKMHKTSTGYVKAESQARIVKELDDFFTDKEKQVIRRGRNAKSNTSPKNADIMDYRLATGFEALIGHLYLNEEYDRLGEVFDRVEEILKG